jgi:hypothetical protein
MARLSTRPFAIVTLFAVGAAATALTLLWPRSTLAEVIPDEERLGEYEEDGMRFGNIVVRGELVPSATAPGGWVLVRTLENKGDAPEKCAVEERVLRTEDMLDARVTPSPTAVVLRNQPIALGPHEKRTLGISLPREIGEQITAGKNTKAAIERARERAMAAEKWDAVNVGRTFMTFHVEYRKALPPGATAAPPVDNGVRRPARMGMMMAPPGAQGAPW